MNDWLSRLHNFARGAWRELPLETLAVAVAAVSSIAAINGVPAGDQAEVWQARLLLGAVLVTPLLFAITLLRRERLITRRANLVGGAVLAAVVLAALTAALPTVDDIPRAAFTWPYGFALLAAALVPFVAVAISAGRDHRLPRFTRFMRIFFEQTTTWALLWLCGFVALLIIAVAVGELFDLHVKRLWGDAVLLMTAGCALSYLYRLLPRPERDGPDARLPELWRRLVTTIGAPFVSVMLVILVVYEIVVLARGELPRNLLSPLIMTAGFVGFFCTLVIVSILRQEVGSSVLTPADPHRWARRRSVRLVRAFPVVLLALLPMAGWALAIRVEQYGFTPFRVARLMALVCLGVLSLLGAVRWLRGRMALTWEVPACVIGVALITAFGPLSAVNLSIHSQANRLDALLTDAGIERRTVAEMPIDATRQVAVEDYWAMTAQITLIAELGGEDALRRVLGGHVAACTHKWDGGEQCLRRLGVERTHDDRFPEYDRVRVSGAFVTELGQLEFVELSRHTDHDSADLRLRLDPRAIVLLRGQRVIAEASLTELIADWQRKQPLHARVVTLRTPDGQVAQVAVREFDLERKPGQEPEISRLEGVWVRPAP